MNVDIAALGEPLGREQVRFRRAALEQLDASVLAKDFHVFLPSDGVVLARNVDPGNAVAASLQAVTLFSLAEDLVRDVLGLPARFSLALDPASSSFAEGKNYDLAKSGQGIKTTQEMIDLYSDWTTRFPIAVPTTGAS